MQAVNSKVLSKVSDIIAALQIILRSQAIIQPDLETPYSQTAFFNPNHCAIELKDQSISAIIIERQHQLDPVLRDISGLQTVMDDIQILQQQLVEQKNKIIESINLHKRLVSPLWRLPTEVLSQIFHCCLPPISEPNVEVSAPILLTSICRRWRDVAVDMPSLWCRLCLEVDDRNWQQEALCSDIWLKRTRGRPLSLGIDIHAKDHSTKLRHLLRPYVNQISSLFVEFCHPGPLMLFTNFLALEKMVLSIHPDSCHGDIDMPSDISRSFSRLPSTLCDLDVSGYSFSLHDLSSFNPAWAHHLTTVAIHMKSNSILHFLKLAPNLSSLTVRIIFEDFLALEPVTHTKLHTLCMIHEDEDTLPPEHFSNMLNALSLPALRVLEVYGLPMWPHEEFKAFVARSKCLLESLTIAGGDAWVTFEQNQEYITLVSSLLSAAYR